MTYEPNLFVKIFSYRKRRFQSFRRIEAYIGRYDDVGASKHSKNLDRQRDIAMQMNDAWQQSHERVANPAFHYVVAWYEPDISSERVWQTVDRTIEALGAENLQWVAALHRDTEHTHAHVLLNRADPETHLAWRTAGATKKLAPLATLRSQNEQIGLHPRARDLEAWVGQRSMQRWLVETVRPRIEQLVADQSATWQDLHRALGEQYGLDYELQAGRGVFVDRVRGKPLIIKAARLHPTLTLESLEQRFGPYQAPAERHVNPELAYSTLVKGFQLPTQAVSHPTVAPLYQQYLDDRRDPDGSRARHLDLRRLECRERTRSQLVCIRQDLRDARREFDEVQRDPRRFVMESIFAEATRRRVDSARRDLSLQLRALALERPGTSFRRWLKAKIINGDPDAEVALQTIREIGKGREADRQEDSGSSVERGRDTTFPSPNVAAGAAVGRSVPQIEQISRDGEPSEAGIVVGTPRAPRSQLDTELETLHRTYRSRYAGYLRSFYKKDGAGRISAIHEQGRSKRLNAIANKAKRRSEEATSLDANDRWRAQAFAVAWRLEEEDRTEAAVAAERQVIHRIVGGCWPKTYCQFVALDAGDDVARRYLATVEQDAIARGDGDRDPLDTKRVGLFRNIVAKTVEAGVAFHRVQGDADTLAFRDEGRRIGLGAPDRQNDAAALLYAARKFGNCVALEGDDHDKARLLEVAVSLGVDVPNRELQLGKAKLLARRKTLLADAELDREREAKERREHYFGTMQNSGINDSERLERNRRLVVETLVAVIAEETPERRVTLSTDGGTGILDRVIALNTRCFAIVDSDQERLIVPISRDRIDDLCVRGGSAVSLPQLVRTREAERQPQVSRGR